MASFIDLCIDHFETNYPKYMDEEQFFSSLMFHVNNACDLVQEEQQKRIAENMNWDHCSNKGFECRTDKQERAILNPENLIK